MNSGLLINMTMSFVVMLGHVFLSGLLINMTMYFVVIYIYIYHLFVQNNVHFYRVFMCKKKEKKNHWNSATTRLKKKKHVIAQIQKSNL